MAADRGRELCYEMLLKNAEQKTFSNLMLGSEDVTDFVRAAVYGTITYLIAIDHVIKHASGKDVSEMDPQTATIVRFGTWQLLFSDKVPSRRGVRIHAGNTYQNSAACVLVGMNRDEAKERIDESKDAEKMVTMLCRNVRSLAIVERY